MLFFGLLGLYLLLKSHDKWGVLASGVVFGLSIASKWPGAVFLVAGVVWLVIDRKFKWATAILASALVAYVISYAPFILVRGFGGFVSLQLWMLNYLPQKQVASPNFIRPLNRIIGPLFFVSTLNPLYTPFVEFGAYYLSVDLPVNPIIALLPYPVLYLHLRRGLRDKASRLIVVTAGLFIALHILTFDPVEAWLFAPATALTCVLAVKLKATCRRV
jgi:predicted membrane-bound dolichyl-phosphate-mannose-protein mannosyltransferase